MRFGSSPDPYARRDYAVLGWSLFTPRQFRRGSPMPFSLGFCAVSAKTKRHYRTLLAPSDDPRGDARAPRWTTQRAVGSLGFLAAHLPRRSRRKLVSLSPGNRVLGH